MGGLQYCQLEGYAAILFRRTHTDLALEGALMDRARDWLSPTDARWNERDKRWEFPSGATLTFGYLDGPNDWRRYDSAEFQFIGLDEATQFRPHDINAVMGRLRRKSGSRIPIRLRLGSNPGGEAHEFLGERFVEPTEPHFDRTFIPALLEDNPYVDRQEYEATLEALKDADPTLYRQRRFGHWVRDEGEAIFKRWWWSKPEARYDPTSKEYQKKIRRRIMAWDTAFETGEENSYTACVTFDVLSDYTVAVRNVWRAKLEFPDLEQAIVFKAKEQNEGGLLSSVIIEKKASAHSVLQTLKLNAPAWLRPMIGPFTPPGDKDEKCRRAAHYCAAGLVMLPRVGSPDTEWLFEAQEEIFNVPNSKHRDITDALSLGVIRLEKYLAEAYREKTKAA